MAGSTSTCELIVKHRQTQHCTRQARIDAASSAATPGRRPVLTGQKLNVDMAAQHRRCGLNIDVASSSSHGKLNIDAASSASMRQALRRRGKLYVDVVSSTLMR